MRSVIRRILHSQSTMTCTLWLISFLINEYLLLDFLGFVMIPLIILTSYLWNKSLRRVKMEEQILTVIAFLPEIIPPQPRAEYWRERFKKEKNWSDLL